MSNRTRRDDHAGGFPDGFEPFEKLEDPRNGRHPRHYFGEIIFIALSAMICGSEGFDDFERFAQAREPWLRKRLVLPGGLPSDDTFRRVFTAIDPDRFCECFAAFVLAISGKLRRQLIAIDGKTLRHSFENADPGTSLHLISSPGHLRHTRQQGGTLSTADESNRAHGRIERRIVLATDSLWWIDKLERESWSGLRSVVCVESHREIIGSGEKSVQKRYYLTTREPDALLLQKLIRQHWSIENQCQWVLDVTFDEDQCRVRKNHAARNLAMLRKVCLSLLKQDTSLKDSLRGKRYRAALDESVLETILFPATSK